MTAPKADIPGRLQCVPFLRRPTGVQTGLDFAERGSELFGSEEMGDDALHALKLCMESQAVILARLRDEIPVLSSALKWSRRVTKG